MSFGVLLLACAVSGPGGVDGASSLCDLLAQVRVIPFKGERVDDNAYNKLKSERLRAIPCLVEKLDDVTSMRDPRKAPSYGGVRVGDVAYFLLIDFTCIPFEEMFPDDLRRRYNQDGVYAYFRFVENPANRRLLRERWRSWLTDTKRLEDRCQPKPSNKVQDKK